MICPRNSLRTSLKDATGELKARQEEVSQLKADLQQSKAVEQDRDRVGYVCVCAYVCVCLNAYMCMCLRLRVCVFVSV